MNRQHGVVKLTQAQLRRIVEGIARRPIREEFGQADVARDVSSAVVSALNTWFDQEGTDLLINNSWEMLSNTFNDDEMPVPARVEDVDHIAETASRYVMSDPELRDWLTKICKQLIESMMQPV